jgi:predicted amidohydrolase YtcJ
LKNITCIRTLRVVGCFAVGANNDDPITEAASLKQWFQSELVQVPVLKMLMNGGVESHTAALLEPYQDWPDFRGELLMPPERFTQIVKRAHAAGLDMHVHAIGDRTTRVTLDAIDAARRETGIIDRQHTICHLQMVD